KDSSYIEGFFFYFMRELYTILKRTKQRGILYLALVETGKCDSAALENDAIQNDDGKSYQVRMEEIRDEDSRADGSRKDKYFGKFVKEESEPVWKI
ncbi:MAG: hypothetical protein IJ733_19215, partial [Lachnospiraceae bacterium]|nr:hypothetical protein [Lachnospiraceae bacterium]